ncbi:MAG: phosphatase PAP2 family protein [bacterium]
MTETLQNVIGQIGNLGAISYLIVALIVLAETTIGIGQFIPGSVILVFTGFLCYLQILDFGFMLIVVFLTHYAGEMFNYYIGRSKGRQLFSADARYFKLSYLEKAERLLRAGGMKVFIIGQFIGMLRPVLSVVAGAVRMPFARFLLYLLVPAFLWAFVHLGVGMLFGASWQRTAQYIEKFPLIVLLTVLIFMLSGWLIRRLTENAGMLGIWYEGLSRRIRHSRHYQGIARYSPGLFAFLEARLSYAGRWGIGATIGWMVTFGLMTGFFLILHNIRTKDEWLDFDYSVHNLMVQIHNNIAERILSYFTALGNPSSIVVAALLAIMICVISRQHRSAAAIGGSVCLSGLFVWMMKLVYARARPETAVAISYDSLTPSFPSGHATLSIALYSALFYWIWNHPGSLMLRKLLGFLVIVFVLTIGCSRVYLGLHFVSDVIAGYFLGLGCVVFVVTLAGNISIISEHRCRADLAGLAVLISGMAVAAASSAYNLSDIRPKMLNSVMITDHDTTSATIARLPRFARNGGGETRMPVNLIILGDAERMTRRLMEQGWRQVSPRDFITTRVRDPIFPAFINNKPAAWTLEKFIHERRLILRIWDSDSTLERMPVWVVSVVAEKRQAKFWGMSVFRIIPDMDAVTDYFAAELDQGRIQHIRGFHKRGLYQWKYPFFTHGGVLLVDERRE